MDKELKAKWVQALRSGEYKQTTGYYVRSDGGFCCLGVLARVCNEPFADAEQKTGGFKVNAVLIDMNDGAGKFKGNQQTFAQIADYIEAHL